ncbi:MAG TPA: dihydrodipicolinate synthase family protein [Pelomicrobium sp.]|nr:dihydrodipicolinate synthase family protein [Pelomicrobium sp.]
MPDFDFRGVVPILPTPFHDDESLDLESLERTIRFMASVGVQGVTVLGVLGESNRLTDAERERCVAAAVKAAGALPVVVGASHPGTQATIDLAVMARERGAAAVMVAPSQEPVPSDERVLDYYRRVGERAGIPLVLQDHPASTQVHLPVPLIARIAAEVPAVACIKEEGLPTPARIEALRRLLQRPLPILTGLGALYGLFDLEQGSDGFNTGFAFPEALLALVAAARERDWPRAREIYRRFLPLIVFEQQPGVAVRKEIFRRRGLLASHRVRHPGAALAPSAAKQLDALLAWILDGTDLTRPLAL